jgi:hypothetical protein
MPKLWNRGRGSWPAEAVYIGRPSKWGNPFSHLPDTLAAYRVATREEAIASYEAWIRTQPHLMRALPTLRGKDLACWCTPLACHGDVLMRLANAPARTFTLAVIGSRSFTDAHVLGRHLDAVIERIARVHGDDVDLRMVSGGARGADTLAEAYADANGIPFTPIRPDYARFGDPAPFVRNKEIVRQADALVAFQRRRSSGTQDAIDFARQLGRPVLVIRV